MISGPAGRVALVGDAFNHPQQVAEPELPSIADGDRKQAIATRREILGRVRSHDWPVAASAHLPGGWWTISGNDDEAWQPLVDDVASTTRV